MAIQKVLIFIQRFLKLCTQYDAEGLGHLCKILVVHGSVLDIVVLHVKLADIMVHGLAVVLDFDCEAVGKCALCV